MLRCIGTLTLVLALLALAVDSARASTSAPMDGPQSAATCFEDEPCWHWPTMGNGMRGIVSMRGTPIVVSACRFSRMMARRGWRERRIMGYGMRGDAWALVHGCAAAHNSAYDS